MGSKDEPGPVESEHQVRTGAELARIAEKNRDLAEELVERARRDGLQLVGESGLLTGLVKLVLEGALEAEMAEHLGYEKGDPAGAGSGNHRNGTSRKTVLSQVGPVTLVAVRQPLRHGLDGLAPPVQHQSAQIAVTLRPLILARHRREHISNE